MFKTTLKELKEVFPSPCLKSGFLLENCWLFLYEDFFLNQLIFKINFQEQNRIKIKFAFYKKNGRLNFENL